jgi:hypothetical protein
MTTKLDQETIERYRSLSARDAFEQAKSTAYRAGAVGSDDFLDLFEQLVDEGILTWDQVEEFNRS